MQSRIKRVADIIAGLPVLQVIGNAAIPVRSLQYDSRKAGKDDAFVAVPGFTADGHDFIETAYRQGCRVFFVERIPPGLKDAVIVQVQNTRQGLAYLARNFYDRAAEALKTVGITGTDGKTTTAYLTYSILQAASWKPGLISTVETRVGEQRMPSERTTPESLDLHQLFYDMYRQGLKSVVMEVSAHALSLHRVEGVPFAAAVFTNLGHDHLDFYPTRENYFLAKKRLFDGLGKFDRAIINLDDPYGQRIIADTPGDVHTFSLENPAATVTMRDYQMLPNGIAVRLDTPAGELFYSTPFVGKFNIYNVMAAVTTALALGIQPPEIARGMETMLTVPGRCEKWVSPAGYRVFIDYAHTPEALQRMLEALLEFSPQRLTVVFGCGGDRDTAKRPKMGKIAEDYADQIILTNDNPRTEAPGKIFDDILRGIYERSKVRIIPDRRAAIETAISQAVRNEIILIAGKGHEDYQEFAHRREPFSDREVVEKLINR